MTYSFYTQTDIVDTLDYAKRRVLRLMTKGDCTVACSLLILKELNELREILDAHVQALMGDSE